MFKYIVIVNTIIIILKTKPKYWTNIHAHYTNIFHLSSPRPRTERAGTLPLRHSVAQQLFFFVQKALVTKATSPKKTGVFARVTCDVLCLNFFYI